MWWKEIVVLQNDSDDLHFITMLQGYKNNFYALIFVNIETFNRV